eukprot:gene22763-27483_t
MAALPRQVGASDDVRIGVVGGCVICSDDDSDDDKPPAKDGHILDLVKRNAVTSDMLKEKLTQHIDQMDNDQALDYAMKLGSFKKQQVFLHNVESKNLQPAIHSTTCVISLLKHEALL